jgi:hypothetical protein
MTSPMKKHFLALAVACIVIAVSSPSHAQNCNSAPPSWGDTSAYESWCKSCGGSVSGSGPRIRCIQGPNWGRTGSTSSSSGGSGAAGALSQPFYNLGYGIGQSIGSALFGDPAEDARRAAEQARAAQDAEAEAAARRAVEARKRQETFNRLSSQLQLSGKFDGAGGNGSGLDLMLGDGTDGLRSQGTSFFGLGGGQGGSPQNVSNDAMVADLRPAQGYSATQAAPATQGDSLPLIMGDPNVVDLSDKKAPHIVGPEAKLEQKEYETMQAQWLKNQKQLIEQRLNEPNRYADAIYKSLKTKAPPPLPPRKYDELQPGDVLLISKEDITDASFWINLGDRITTDVRSPASHTVLYLKEVKGKKLFLDHTPGKGSHVIDENEFLRTYGNRDILVASSQIAVAQPVREAEAARIWEATKELVKKEADSQKAKSGNIVDQTGYGFYGNDNMVCSEASRWVLVKSGRDIPETASPLKKLLGIHYGPANFYSDDYNFIITPLWAAKEE